MLKQISPFTSINLKKIEAVERGENDFAIVFISGRSYESQVNYDLMIEMINEEQQRPIQTTSPSEFAG